MFALLMLASTTSAFGAEVVVVLPDGLSPADLRHPGVGFAEGGRGRERHLNVDASGEAWLATLGIESRPLSPPPTAEGYRSPEEMVQAIEDLVDQSHDLAARVDLGHSVDGRPIVGLRLSATTEPRARLRILGAHHGDETISATVALETAHELVAAWAAGDDAVVDLFDETELWIVPHVNPDGVHAHTRHNAQDVDLNRNYGYLWRSDEYHPGVRAFSEPEARAVQALAVRAPPALGLSLHSGASNFGWVWNHTLDPAPDAAMLSEMADDYAVLCTMPGFWTTNGAAWYPTNGDTNDWSYGRWGTLDFTLELSEAKAPAPDAIDAVVNAHLDAILDFVVQTELSTARFIDSTTGRPVAATVLDPTTGSLSRTTSDGRHARVSSDNDVLVRVPGYREMELPGSGHHADVAVVPELRMQADAVWPPLLRAGDAALVDTAALGDAVRVHPPGHPAIPLHGHEALSLAGLPPGLWVVEGTQGLGVLRVNGESAARVDRIERDTDGWHLSLDQGGHGRVLWLVVDGRLDRRLTADTIDTALFVAEASVPGDDAGIVDLAIWGPGGPTWVHDLHGQMRTHDSPTPGTSGLDTGQGWTPRDGRVTGCGCQASPTGFSPLLLALVPVHLRRRRR